MSRGHSRTVIPMEPASASSAASVALAKYFGSQIVMGVIATALAFLVLPPKTKTEFFGRMICTLLASYLFGPILVAVVHGWFPGLFDSAAAVAALNGQDPSFGVLYISAPLQVIAGMPAWWIIGAFVRWFDRRQSGDIGDMFADVRGMFLPGSRRGADAEKRQPRISPRPDDLGDV